MHPSPGCLRDPVVGRGLHGLRRDQVLGPEPSYVAGTLAGFPNDHTLCRGLWLPTADRWLVRGVAGTCDW